MDAPPASPDRLRRHHLWWWTVPLAAVVLVVALVADRLHDKATTAAPSSPPSAGSLLGAAPCTSGMLAGLVIDPDRLGTGGMLERRDDTAADGPWTAVVRAPDGSLGRHGAVITFPVDPPPPGRPIAVNGAAGTASDNSVVWPISGAHARIRGDLGEPKLLALASLTSVIAGRPTVQPIDSLSLVSTGPYRPPTVHEVRYGSATLGEEKALGGGLAYTGVVTGGGFEDQLYAQETTPGGTVRCRPAVASRVFGGNGTLAWEPYPGTVAYIGYSGSPMGAEAIAALQRIANRCQVLNDSAWQASRPTVRNQTNDVS